MGDDFCVSSWNFPSPYVEVWKRAELRNKDLQHPENVIWYPGMNHA